MTPVEQTAVDLYGTLQRWLGFREGYSAYVMAVDLDRWCIESEQTRRWADRLDRLGYGYPHELVRLVVHITADLRGKSVREAWREISRNARLAAEFPQYGREVDRLTFWLYEQLD